MRATPIVAALALSLMLLGSLDAVRLGAERPLEAASAAAPAPPAPPAAPAPCALGVPEARATERYVQLRWEACDGVERYVVLRGASPDALEPLAEVGQASFVDIDLPAGAEVVYAIAAEDVVSAPVLVATP